MVALLGHPNVEAADVSGTLIINRAVPTLTWTNPADIDADTAPTATQLDANASVPGTLTYTPSAGTTFGAGPAQTLTVHFTPDDTIDYTTATTTVLINVKSPPTPTPTPPVFVTGIHWETRKLLEAKVDPGPGGQL